MSDDRDRILGGIRAALGRGPLDEAGRRALTDRLRDHPPGVVPAMAPEGEDRAGLLRRFLDKAEATAATVARVDGWAAVPEALADYLKGHNLPTALAVAPDKRLDPVEGHGLFTVRRGPALPQDGVGVTVAAAGMAETGSLLLTSGPDTPTSLNFLPDVHIITVAARDVVDGYEQAWARLREAFGGTVPRTVNMVTGPSRTGDIEQTIQLGAHGPRRVHVVLVDEPPS